MTSPRDPDKDPSAADRLLRQSVRRGGRWTVVLAFTTFTLAAAELAFPAVLAGTVDAVLGRHSATGWLAACGALVAVLVAVDALDDVAGGTATARSTAWLRRSVLDHVLALGPRTARRFGTGDLAARLVGNAADTGRAGPVLIRALGSLVPAVGGIVALALIDVWLFLTFLVGAPVLVLLVRATVRDASAVAEEYLRLQGTIAARLADALAGVRTIAAAHSVDRERARVLGPLPALSRSGMGMWRVQTRISAQEALLVPLLEVAVLAVAGLQLARGQLSPGDVLAASAYVAMAAGIGDAVGLVTQYARAKAAAARNAEVLTEPAARYGTERLPAGRGRIELRGVRVGDVLRDVDLTVPGGALVAVVGRSGTGKSVLAALLGRLVEPDAGEVRLDGVPLPHVERDELRHAVGYGFERPVLVGQTLLDVIAFGSRTATREEVVVAACAARADDFIRRMPDGYATRLADVHLSGGEAQRVGLARAFAHTGRVLVLDDVAASLDTVTEHHIREVLTGALADRTRVVVAHRASTAAQADLVVWLDGGTVRVVAPHDELWQDPAYREVFG